IRRLYAQCGYLADPHTACGLVAAERTLGSDSETPQVVLATAHPAKFPDAMQKITGKRPPLPSSFDGLEQAPERFTTIANDLEAAKTKVAELAVGVREARK